MGVAGKAFFLFLILLGIRLWIKKVLDIEKDNKKIKLIKGAPDKVLKYTSNYLDEK